MAVRRCGRSTAIHFELPATQTPLSSTFSEPRYAKLIFVGIFAARLKVLPSNGPVWSYQQIQIITKFCQFVTLPNLRLPDLGLYGRRTTQAIRMDDLSFFDVLKRKLQYRLRGPGT